ncbi:class II fructose-bisphosphatase [soil metagenome]
MTVVDVDVGLDVDALVMHLLSGTQQAALACRSWIGRGDSDGADRAAVAAMRRAFERIPGRGTVVLGEGEKDDAPMLYIGEHVGDGHGPRFDLAVDPLENTNACARDADGAIAVVAGAPQGTLWGSAAAWYMDKLVVGPDAADVIDIERPVEDNLEAIAGALDKPIDELTTIVLDKPRHERLVERIHATGAKVGLIADGDVAGALRVLLPGSRADALIGVGGAPEGVITACAVRLLRGGMQAALAPQSDHERGRVLDAGQQPDTPLGLGDLVATDHCCFVATSVTWGELLRGPERAVGGWRTRSFVASPLHPRLVVGAVHPDGAAEGTEDA